MLFSLIFVQIMILNLSLEKFWAIFMLFVSFFKWGIKVLEYMFEAFACYEWLLWHTVENHDGVENLALLVLLKKSFCTSRTLSDETTYFL